MYIYTQNTPYLHTIEFVFLKPVSNASKNVFIDFNALLIYTGLTRYWQKKNLIESKDSFLSESRDHGFEIIGMEIFVKGNFWWW